MLDGLVNGQHQSQAVLRLIVFFLSIGQIVSGHIRIFDPPPRDSGKILVVLKLQAR